MKNNRVLSSQELAQFGAELDALKARVTADLDESDARYINNIYKAVNYTEAAGRGLLFAGIFPPAWIAGTALLGVSKILENMELGHNVMHGQYDWMRDSRFNGKNYEWDIVGTADNWRKTHNFKHHTYTNIKGMDEACGLARFAGMSDLLMSIGFYDYNPTLDKSDVTAKQLAQMVWYFVEGVSLRRNDYPIVDEKDFNMFIVQIEDAENDFIFLKSKKSDRWSLS